MPEARRNEEGNVAEAGRKIAICRDERSAVLGLGGLGLRNLPEGVRSLHWLQLLQVRENQLRRIPEWIGELTELHSLYVWGNPIEALPASIARLPKLRHLAITMCPAHVATETIGAISTLQSLSMGGMGLRQIPEWIRQLRDLTHLALYHNRLTDLPEWLAELEKPVVVRACRFEKLPLGKIQAILPGGKPVKQHSDRDRAWFEVTKQIDRVIARLKK